MLYVQRSEVPLDASILLVTIWLATSLVEFSIFAADKLMIKWSHHLDGNVFSSFHGNSLSVQQKQPSY